MTIFLYIRRIEQIINLHSSASPRDQRARLRQHGIKLLQHIHPGVQIGYGHHGKPLDESHKPLAFNSSHSQQFYALAFSWDCQTIGIDIEDAHRQPPVRALSERYFHPQEQAWCEQQGWDSQAFLQIWTRKEALLKADGCGLNFPLKSINTLATDWHSMSREGLILPNWDAMTIATHRNKAYIYSVAWQPIEPNNRHNNRYNTGQQHQVEHQANVVML